jgi:hypothetical protein
MSATLTVPDISAEAWALPEPQKPIKLGSEEHKRLFCRTLLDTFDPYRPAVLDWPKLTDKQQAQITSLPIWDIAVQTEGKAGLRVQTYADRAIADPLLKKATDLNAYEEKRHKLVLHNMVQAYGIKLAPEPDYKVPKDAEWAFMVTGFSECIDSFFAFGLFEMAKRSGLFPPELVDTFEPVMKEEGRHILYFVNWVAWSRRNMPLWRRPWFELKVMAVWVFLGWERIGLVTSFGGDDAGPAQDNNFTLTGAEHLGIDVSIGGLFDVCLAENDRRLGVYDARLLRPMFIPRLVRLARGVMRLFTGK